MNSQNSKKRLAGIEVLEQRIAPAALTDVAPAVRNSSILLDADPNTPAPAGLTLGNGGSYMIYVTKGTARVFIQDLNNNGQVDYDEIVGISAGDGLRMIAFVDIHGDIVTNLNPDGSLTDSDGNASNGRDGQILLNSRIEKIEMRSVTAADLAPGDTLLDRVAVSSYSIFGNIYAGGGFGTDDGGLIIDSSGFELQRQLFNGSSIVTIVDTIPQIGSIRVGSAASGGAFSFGVSSGDDIRGVLAPFVPASGAAGADIINVRSVLPSMKFSLGTLQAGDGGYNGRGGDIINPLISGDYAGGYSLIAGNGGNGPTGARGGNVTGWADFGTIGSEVYVRTGDGGVGILGKGGNGGNLTFAQGISGNVVEIGGRVRIELGDGGNGLTGGGNGGSQASAKLKTAEVTVPSGTDIVSSWHKTGAIGQLTLGTQVVQGFDFDGDGYNDVVYASRQNGGGLDTSRGSQLVVMFGTPFGGFDVSRTIYLNGPANAVLTIGDFNNDGKADIAAASGDSSYAGIAVFLSQYDPVSGAFTGFADPRYSALPTLGQNVNVTSQGPNDPIASYTAYQVFEIVAADVDGDGAVDLLLHTNQGIHYMRGDLDLTANQGTPGASGYFFADYTSNNGLLPIHHFTPEDRSETSNMKATALVEGAAIDVVILGIEGEGSVFLYRAPGGVFGSAVEIDLGKVDTNRGTGANQVSLTDATFRDMVILDLDNDGAADIIGIAASPEQFIVGLRGSGTGVFTFASNAPTSPDNDGIFYGTGTGGQGLGQAAAGAAIQYVNALNAEPGARQIALHIYSGGNIIEGDTYLAVLAIADNFYDVNRVAAVAAPDPYKAVGNSPAPLFDSYLPNPSSPELHTAIQVHPSLNDRQWDTVGTFRLNASGIPSPNVFVGGFYVGIEQNGWLFSAGDGGDAISGRGGNGGVIGKTLTFNRAENRLIGSFDIVLPSSAAYEGFVALSAGNGGDGFTGAGSGGSVSGVSVSYRTGVTLLTSSVLLSAGNGGDSVRGAGGNGGSLVSFSIETGRVFTAGDGGSGRTGGRGGSIVGNAFGLDASVGFEPGPFSPPEGDIENSRSSRVVVIAGDGGAGLVQGGAGGGISGFTPRFLQIAGGTGGLLFYQAGHGGDSVRGKGGAGGSVVDSSPVSTANYLAGDIFIAAGNGGNGKSGGNGGSIAQFKNVPTSGISPASFTLLAGNGGSGTSGAGGRGGSIQSVIVSGAGYGFQWYFDYSDLDNPDQLRVEIPYSRIVAGAGGSSVGGAGGNGGDLVNVVAAASASSIAAVGGRGGDGLQRGGNGGSIRNSTIDSATENGGFLPDAQTLIIAGEGGDAYAGPRRAGDVLAPGGKNPVGGNGGSIINFRQVTAGEVNVQLIAGNGGSLINAGSPTDVKAKVGKGGSITGVAVAGRIGNTGDPGDELIPIVAYNPLYDGDFSNDRMSDFVRDKIVGDPRDPSFVLPNIDSSVGNVGIVVGAKGRVRDANNDGFLDPAPDFGGSVPNGSLKNVRAQHIMSAVAGHVERIAAIQVLTNVRVTVVGGEYGSDRGVDSDLPPDNLTSNDNIPYTVGPTPGSLDYLDEFGNHRGTGVGPKIGGRLVDGAIVAKNSRDPLSDRDFQLA